MIPNILVASIVLPNKPLSNLEIIDAAKINHCMDLEEHFERHSSHINKTKRMWYFKFGFIIWQWFTLGYVVHKGKDKFYFDSYGVQPPGDLITYLKSPIFYNSERVQ